MQCSRIDEIASIAAGQVREINAIKTRRSRILIRVQQPMAISEVCQGRKFVVINKQRPALLKQSVDSRLDDKPRFAGTRRTHDQDAPPGIDDIDIAFSYSPVQLVGGRKVQGVLRGDQPLFLY